ncbi:MAG: ABC transporter ATP-binding protein [Chloroflexi bacterium]|nr:MAG: ABC transporter ATP-binding protein [Chloroflexota bacterium]RLC87063.1 MAG: ABC transporter ATP-binding protein [Chloroflexota bacterium]
MIAINLDRVTVTYISEPVFERLSWEIHDDRVVGLIGPNGCGKSTLLKLIVGELTSDTGFTVRRKGLTIGYLQQEPRLEPARTVWQEMLAASTELKRIEDELTHVEARLADPVVYGDEKKLTRALDRQARLLDEYERLGGPGYEGRVRSTLRSLGFSDADCDLPVGVLSGGQKKLVGLAKLLVTQPDLLLLDEPDNHLDLEGKAFLGRFIRGYKGAVIIVSHDRYLLDMVADEIVELEDGRLAHYPGNYSEYAFEKQMRLLRQQQLYQVQQKEIKRLEQAAKRLMTWGAVYDNVKFIRRGKNILKRLERMDRLDRPVLERKRMGLELEGWRGSNKVLEIVDLDKEFDDAIILAGLDLLLWRGERVGLVGPNGAGKSLLFRLILGQETVSGGGEIKIGPSVKVGYYAQEHETLDYDRTLIETVRYAAKLSEEGAVRFLGRFLFTYEQARGRVANLSGGERSRLQMALLMLSGTNFLLLDEPTNNLDIPSAEVLEDALADFEGTVLVISHDRYFLDRVVGRIVELDEGALAEYSGGYSDYQAAKATR